MDAPEVLDESPGVIPDSQGSFVSTEGDGERSEASQQPSVHGDIPGEQGEDWEKVMNKRSTRKSLKDGKQEVGDMVDRVVNSSSKSKSRSRRRDAAKRGPSISPSPSRKKVSGVGNKVWVGPTMPNNGDPRKLDPRSLNVYNTLHGVEDMESDLESSASQSLINPENRK